MTGRSLLRRKVSGPVPTFSPAPGGQLHTLTRAQNNDIIAILPGVDMKTDYQSV